MHQQIAFLIVLLAFRLDNSSGHGKRRDARGADERIDFASAEQAHELSEEHSHSGIEADSNQTERENHESLRLKKLLRFHGRADAKPKQQSDDIRDVIFRGEF